MVMAVENTIAKMIRPQIRQLTLLISLFCFWMDMKFMMEILTSIF